MTVPEQDALRRELAEAREANDSLLQELVKLRSLHRWNVEDQGSDLLICRGHHDKTEDCEYVRYVPADAAEAQLAVLTAQVERMSEALKLLLPFVDKAAGEGLGFVEEENGSPYMDAADICAVVAKTLGLELGSDAYLAVCSPPPAEPSRDADGLEGRTP